MKAATGRPNWKNRTIWTADNIKVLRQMNSASVDLIYLDPPFNSKANYAAPIGTPAEGAEFSDIFNLDDVKAYWIEGLRAKHPRAFKAILASHTDSNKAYLAYMAPRLLEMHRVLRDTGSLFLHCDATMSHYLKVLLDAVFGPNSLRNEIVWCYSKWTNDSKQFQRNHDIIFWYSKTDSYTFNPIYKMTPHKQKVLERGWDSNKPRGLGVTQLLVYDREKAAAKIAEVDKLPGWRVVYCEDKDKGVLMGDWWDDTPPLASSSKERTGYPTQKPLALLKRIIAAAAKKGDVVLDPFCGCATTLVEADRQGLDWVGIDTCDKAADLVVSRIKEDQGRLFEEVIHRRDMPRRTDQGKVPPYSSPANKNLLYGEQGGNCKGCLVHFHKRNLTIDHIIPRNEGGGDEIENLQLLCGACNSTKGDRDMTYLLKVLEMEQSWKGRKSA